MRVGLAIVVVVAACGGGGPSVDPCTGLGDRIAGTWSEDRKARVAPLATFGDGYARDLRAARCHTEERAVCLEGLRRGFHALASRFEQGTAEIAVDAIRATRALPPVASCDAPLVRPPDPVVRARVDEVRARLAELRAGAGSARAALVPIVVEAEATGFAPVIAEVRELEGVLAHEAGELAEAKRAFERAALRGTEARAFRVVARALIGALAVAGDAGRFDDVAGLRTRAEAAIEAAGDPALRIALLEAAGVAATQARKFGDAGRDLEAAIGATAARDPKALELVGPLHAQARLLVQLERLPEALVPLERAKAIQVATFGEAHPEVAATLELMARIYSLEGDDPAAISASEKAVAIHERVFGAESTHVADAVAKLADTMLAADQPSRAIELYRRAIAIDAKLCQPDEPAPLEHRAKLAVVYDLVGQSAESADEFLVLISLFAQRYGLHHVKTAEVQASYARVLLGVKRYERAIEYARIAMHDRRASLPDYPAFAELQTIGEAHLELGQPAEAVVVLTEVVESAAKQAVVDAGMLAWSNALLGRALVDAGVDRTRGTKLVRDAWKQVAADERLTRERTRLAAWMQRRKIRPG